MDLTNSDYLRAKFLANGMPYDDIDPEMIELLDVLNFHLGLKTKFCCYGHDSKTHTYVIFHESVTDEQIDRLAEQAGREYLEIQLQFYKWVRYYPLMKNWKLEVGKLFFNPDSMYKKQHLDKIVEKLKSYSA